MEVYWKFIYHHGFEAMTEVSSKSNALVFVTLSAELYRKCTCFHVFEMITAVSSKSDALMFVALFAFASPKVPT